MTLIVSYHHPHTHLLAISDILTSAPLEKGASPATVQLPFNEAAIQHENAGDGVAGLAQKSVIFGQTMVMWAGRAIYARVIIEAIRAASVDGVNFIEIKEIIEGCGLTQSQVEEVSLIYHYSASRDLLRRNPWRCSVMVKDGEASTLADGSGANYFFENLSIDIKTGVPSHVAAVQAILGKLAFNPLSETNDKETLDFLYGGWFELMGQSHPSFFKTSYAVKLWSRDSESLGSGGPLVIGWYSGHNLILTRAKKIEDSNGTVRLDLRHTPVLDFLRRDDAIAIPSQKFRPQIVINIVMDIVENRAYTNIETDPALAKLIVECGPGGVDVTEAPDLRQYLWSLRDESVPTEVIRNWTPD